MSISADVNHRDAKHKNDDNGVIGAHAVIDVSTMRVNTKHVNTKTGEYQAIVYAGAYMIF